MAIKIEEIMNPEVYAVRQAESAEVVKKDLVRLGISGAPVVDDRMRPVGVVSLKDLVSASADAPVEDVMSRPTVVAPSDMPIPVAGQLMAEASVHRLIVTDGEKVVGVVGALDIIRAQLGLPRRSPSSFPHYDVQTGTVWSDDLALDWAHLEAAPTDAGVVLVLRGGLNQPETVVWGEAVDNLRQRVSSYLESPANRPSFVAYWRAIADLRFRTAVVPDPDERVHVLALALR